MKLPPKRIGATGAVALLISILFAWNRASGPGVAFAQSQAQTSSKPEMSDAAFKNIQVLKGIPVDEFMGTMGLFSAALSVCCGDCHVNAGTDHPDWAADPPRKRIARQMVTMVSAINRDNFRGRQVVTCWTCHRGAQSPATTPPLDTIYNNAPVFMPPDVLPLANPATAGTPPADQILDKYVQALGGADRLSKLTSYTAKGNSHLFGEVNNDAVEIYAKAPNLLATIVHQKEGDLARTYNGREAWVMLPLTVVKEYPLNASALDGAKLDAQMAFPGGLKQFFSNWKVTFPTTVPVAKAGATDDAEAATENRDVYVVQGTDTTGLLATFYFDKQTGLLLRMIRYANSAVGRVPTQWDFSDYRPVAGVMMPFKWTFGWVSGREEYTLTDVQPNASVDMAKFNQPVQRSR
jgi:photosynthetic reaction center cytochrome c subunit